MEYSIQYPIRHFSRPSKAGTGQSFTVAARGMKRLCLEVGAGKTSPYCTKYIWVPSRPRIPGAHLRIPRIAKPAGDMQGEDFFSVPGPQRHARPTWRFEAGVLPRNIDRCSAVVLLLSDIAVLLMIQTEGSTAMIRALCGEGGSESTPGAAKALRNGRGGRQRIESQKCFVNIPATF
jgi:hypothetical protein